jgi:hypothetical protein
MGSKHQRHERTPSSSDDGEIGLGLINDESLTRRSFHQFSCCGCLVAAPSPPGVSLPFNALLRCA